MNTKEKYTISEASELLGFKSRSTLNKRTKEQGSDAISYELDENGTKVISIIELQRVFPEHVKRALERNQNTANTDTKYSAKIQSNTTKNTTNTVWLTEKIELLEELLSKEKQERDRERIEAHERERRGEAREEKLQDQITELTKTISHQTRLLEHHQKVPVTDNEIGGFKKPNKILQIVTDELSSLLKSIGFVSIIICVLFITLYFSSNQDDGGLKQKQFSTQKSKIQKEKVPVTLPIRFVKEEPKNYTPLPR